MKYDRFHYGILCGAILSWAARFTGEGDLRGLILFPVGILFLILGVMDMRKEKNNG